MLERPIGQTSVQALSAVSVRPLVIAFYRAQKKETSELEASHEDDSMREDGKTTPLVQDDLPAT